MPIAVPAVARFEILDTMLDCETLTLSAWLLSAETGCEYEVLLDFDESTACVVEWWVELDAMPMALIDHAEKLAAEMWAGGSSALVAAHARAVDSARDLYDAAV